MVANVESMMYFGEVPWHGLGHAVTDAQTSAEAIVAAGLDWKVETQPICTAKEPSQLIDTHRAITRVTDNSVLGVVGGRYVPIQNTEMFEFFDNVVQEKAAMYHTAGSLDGGKKIWIMAKLPGEIVVKGHDVTEKYLLLASSHDGSCTLKMQFTPIRVVCQNTLNMALKANEKMSFSLRHTKNALEKVKDAKDALGIVNKFYDKFQETAEVLASTRVTDAQMQSVLSKLFPPPKVRKDKEYLGEVESTQALKAKSKILELWETGQGIQPFRGTGWAAVNAIAEYADHYKTVRAGNSDYEEAKIASVWMGSAASFKQEGLQLLQEIVF